MKSVIMATLLLATLSCYSQQQAPPSLKSVLLNQLKSAHNVKDWFVPPTLAIEGLTVEQANWKDSSENHSIAQLTTHLIFWNKQLLEKFNGQAPDPFSGDNRETFTPVTSKSWNATRASLDSILTAWENIVRDADETKLEKWYPVIANISTHNAYHTGQIIYIRKMRGWWNAENGVK